MTFSPFNVTPKLVYRTNFKEELTGFWGYYELSEVVCVHLLKTKKIYTFLSKGNK